MLLVIFFLQKKKNFISDIYLLVDPVSSTLTLNLRTPSVNSIALLFALNTTTGKLEFRSNTNNNNNNNTNNNKSYNSNNEN